MTVTSLILKVPESAHMRIELNKIDSAGLDNAEALRFKDDNLWFVINLNVKTLIDGDRSFVVMMIMIEINIDVISRMVDIMAAQQLGLPERFLQLHRQQHYLFHRHQYYQQHHNSSSSCSPRFLGVRPTIILTVLHKWAGWTPGPLSVWWIPAVVTNQVIIIIIIVIIVTGHWQWLLARLPFFFSLSCIVHVFWRSVKSWSPSIGRVLFDRHLRHGCSMLKIKVFGLQLFSNLGLGHHPQITKVNF